MEKNLVTIPGSRESSVKFRESAWDLAKNGPVYVRKNGTGSRTYHLVDADMDHFRIITVEDLFDTHYPPIRVETFAQALVRVDREGRAVPTIDVFNL